MADHIAFETLNICFFNSRTQFQSNKRTSSTTTSTMYVYEFCWRSHSHIFHANALFRVKIDRCSRQGKTVKLLWCTYSRGSGKVSPLSLICHEYTNHRHFNPHLNADWLLQIRHNAITEWDKCWAMVFHKIGDRSQPYARKNSEVASEKINTAIFLLDPNV